MGEVRRKSGVPERVVEWAKEKLRDFPWRRDLSPYRILVAEFLLKRTTAMAAEGVYRELIEKYPNIEALAHAEKGKLKEIFSGIGLQEQRSEGMLKAANFIVEELKGEIPREKSELLKIPHVGPYTASAVLSLGFGKAAALLDSNVERVLRRLHSGDGSLGRGDLHELAESYVPEGEHARYNLGLLDLGALVCRYDRPRCEECPIRGKCDYRLSHV